jgi:predicted enzyme related to lactoylglutathione lyase
MDATTNGINWFEIPVTDMQRATFLPGDFHHAHE